MGKNREVSEISLANLNRFKPGVSGNPNGRPVGVKNGLRARFRQVLASDAPKDIIAVLEAKGVDLQNRDHAEVITHVTTREAMKGNLSAVKLLIEQTEDAIPKAVNLMGADGGPIEMEWTVRIVDPDFDNA